MAAGTLTIYLGAASGAGKTTTMIQDACRAAKEGRGGVLLVDDVRDWGRPAIQQLVATCPLPRTSLWWAALRASRIRRKGVRLVVVDELMTPFRQRAARRLLANGIDVCTTLNVYHVGDVAARVEAIVGHPMGPPFAADLLASARIVLVDAPPEVVLGRFEHGLFRPGVLAQQLVGVYEEHTLAGLRDLAVDVARWSPDNGPSAG